MPKPLLLGVNIDHIATLRQARKTRYPDPVQAAIEAEQAGADGITVHLREDLRHIQPRDVRLIHAVIQSRLNLEMAVTTDMINFALDLKPAYACFVPEKREELTTEGGLDVLAHFQTVRDATAKLQDAGIAVSLFIDPCTRQVEAAQEAGAQLIEINTGRYADATDCQSQTQALQAIQTAVSLADDLGFLINAGHGLHYHNIQPIAAIQALHELNIGHGIIARALFTGLKDAVRDMRQLMQEARYEHR